MPIIGTTPDAIDVAEDRERFQQLIERLGLLQPPNRTARTDEAGGGRSRSRSATRWWCGRPTCWAAGRWRSSTARTTCARYMREAVKRLQRLARAARPVPRRRHRGRRRRGLRRQGRADRRHHGAHRAGRHPLRRLRLLAAALHAAARRCRTSMREQIRKMALELGVVGLMNIQFAIKDERHLRARGEPARLAHRAVRLQGDRRAAGQDRGALHGRAHAGRAGPLEERIPKYYSRQGGRVPLHQVPRRRHRARPGDEVDRRGDGRPGAPSARPSPRRRGRGRRAAAGRQGAARRVRDGGQAPASSAWRAAWSSSASACVATSGTADAVQAAGIACSACNKVHEGRPHVVDMIKNDEISLIVNTTEGKQAILTRIDPREPRCSTR